jgi:cysteinyl-tRNA synthetase
MTIKLYNTLTKQVEELSPLSPEHVAIYSCGPTVYDHAHIGNLRTYIFADTMHRALEAAGLKVKRVMNYTDVDDKTIRRSHETYPDEEPMAALKKLTSSYIDLFLEDMQRLGNRTDNIEFMSATENIEPMKKLISDLHQAGFAYIADDGVYFSIATYQKSGKKYGQLLQLSAENTSQARIQNDEYDKDSVHDFALWKTQKGNEPAWEFTLEGKDLTGRPGWHIECSAMAHSGLGQPFDIHTGGVDNIFPHHENEIAQSTALEKDPTMAQFFVHGEHLLVESKKMAKSANNFYTLQDIIDRPCDPLAFRLMILQSHYRSQANFSWENVEAADNRLSHWRQIAALRHQTHDTLASDKDKTAQLLAAKQAIVEALSNDLDTPGALAVIDDAFGRLDSTGISAIHQSGLDQLLELVDATLGLGLKASTPDISDDQKRKILERQNARQAQNWQVSDEIRDELLGQGIALKDGAKNATWFYV